MYKKRNAQSEEGCGIRGMKHLVPFI